MDLTCNSAPPHTMYVDINSCFATVEQQANPRLRHKPLVVAARSGAYGCILAASVDAKRQGIKTGMRVKEALQIEPKLIILPPDPDKYRHVHQLLKIVLDRYTDRVCSKSIDEFCFIPRSPSVHRDEVGPMLSIAHEIKSRIKTDVGDYITVSIGVGTNRFLAKTASNLHKPDGLDVITHTNIQEVFSKIELMDLCGISHGNAFRLNQVGIITAREFLNASFMTLKAAFKSVAAEYWYTRLRGWEIDDVTNNRRGFSQSYVLPKTTKTLSEALPILVKLTHKLSQRIRSSGYQVRHINLGIRSGDHHYWHTGKQLTSTPMLTSDYIHYFESLFAQSPYQTVKQLAISCDKVSKDEGMQLNFFSDEIKNEQVSFAVDQVNHRFGDYTVTSATMITAKDDVPDAIAFGRL